MKHIIYIMLVAAVALGGWFFFTHETVNAPATTTEVETSVPANQTPAISEIPDVIVVTSPTEQASVTSPITLSGEARGYWFFEASAPVVVVDWDGLIIGEGYVTAQGDWMTEDFVPFTGTIEYSLPSGTPYNQGTVIFKKDNPSGLPEHDAALEVPVVFQ